MVVARTRLLPVAGPTGEENLERALQALLEAQERLRRLRARRALPVEELRRAVAEVHARRATVERLLREIEQPYPLPRIQSPARYAWRLYEALWYAGERGLSRDEMIRLVYRERPDPYAWRRVEALRCYLARRLPPGLRMERVPAPGGARWRLVRDDHTPHGVVQCTMQ
jgi:hypothetical protein